LTVPIGTHGVLQAFATRPDAFDERDRELTELLADHVRITLTRLEQDQRMREQRAALRRENERLEDFVRIVSHDLRNPLNVVDGHLELAREDGDEHIEQADAALDRAFELIDDLLALAQEGQAVGEREPVDLAALAYRCWRNVDPAEADLVVDADHRVEADPSRLGQLLENLFRNAVEHGTETTAGVTITVQTTPTGFVVADDGPGIPEDERETIFEAGYSTREGGTGFGLSIVQEIAEAHGWTIRVTESESGGARFEFVDVTIVSDPS
jgi:signal transduction histidine kinase